MQSSTEKEKISKTASSYRKGCMCSDCRPDLYRTKGSGKKPKYKDKYNKKEQWT